MKYKILYILLFLMIQVIAADFDNNQVFFLSPKSFFEPLISINVSDSTDKYDMDSIQKNSSGIITENKKIGEGTFGVVYESKVEGRQCAIKIKVKGGLEDLLSDLGGLGDFNTQPSELEQIHIIYSKISMFLPWTPKLIGTIKMDNTGELIGLIIEFINGISLDVALEKKTIKFIKGLSIDVDKINSLLNQLGKMCDYYYEKDFFLWDGNIENFIITNDGILKLIDMGSLKSVELNQGVDYNELDKSNIKHIYQNILKMILNDFPKDKEFYKKTKLVIQIFCEQLTKSTNPNMPKEFFSKLLELMRNLSEKNILNAYKIMGTFADKDKEEVQELFPELANILLLPEKPNKGTDTSV